MRYFKKIVYGLVLVGQLLSNSVRPSFAQEADRFKNNAGKDSTMPRTAVREVVLSVQAVREKVEEIKRAKPTDIPAIYATLSEPQKAQVSFYINFNLYKTRPSEPLTLDEAKAIANVLKIASEYAQKSRIATLSDYHAGQVFVYSLFEYFKMNKNRDSVAGTQLYEIIDQLYKRREEPAFDNGCRDAALENKLGDDSKYRLFVNTYTFIYKPYRERAEEEMRTARLVTPPYSYPEYLKEGFDLKPMPTSHETSFSTERVDDATLAFFVRMFNIDPSFNRHQKIEALISKFQDLFTENEKKLDRENARLLLYAFTEAYRLQDATLDKDMFKDWLAWAVTEPGMFLSLKLNTHLFEPEPIISLFNTWFDAEGIKLLAEPEQEKRLLAKIKAHPSLIKEKSMETFITDFENTTSHDTFERIVRRLQFINDVLKYASLKTKSISAATSAEYEETLNLLDKKLNVNALIAERGKLESWLDSLYPDIKETDKQSKVELQLGALLNAFRALQGSYIETNAKNVDGKVSIVTYLQTASANPKLFALYKQFVLGFDAATLRLLTSIDLSLTPVKFLGAVKKAYITDVTETRILDAQREWFTDYFGPNSFNVRQTANFAEAQAFINIGFLPPIVAIAFANYLDNIKESGAESPTSRRIIVETVSRLSQLNPLLAVKYFQAISHIATITGNPRLYAESLIAIRTQIEGSTKHIYDPLATTQLGARTNITAIISHLANSFEALAAIDKNALIQYNRYQVLDNWINFELIPPHLLRQRAQQYKPGLLIPDDRFRYGLLSDSPFPPVLGSVFFSTPLTVGGVNVNPTSYSASVTPLSFSIYDRITTGTQQFKLSLQSYLWPALDHPSVSDFLLGRDAFAVSTTQLLAEINRAFIATTSHEYSGDVIAGSAGLALTERGDNITGGGSGAFLTSTGGYSFSGGGAPDRTVASATVNAVPLFEVPAIGGEGSYKVDARSGIAGFEKNRTSKTQRTVVELLTEFEKVQDPDKAPRGNALILLQRETAEILEAGQPEAVEKKAVEKQWALGRFLYYDREGEFGKKGTVYELTGGINELVDPLNFIAAYADRAGGSETTIAGNVETALKRGGLALAIDVGQLAALGHFQAVPLLTRKGEKQPVLLEWTPVAAYTTKEESEMAAKYTTHEVGAPGSYLRVSETGETYGRQGLNYRLRNVTERKIVGWEKSGDIYVPVVKTQRTGYELSVGADVLVSPRGARPSAGVFYREVGPRHTFGQGLYYESAVANLQAIALVNQTANYVADLHRVGYTIYTSREAANRMLVGFLGHVVAQIKNDANGYQFDNAFYRFIGVVKGWEAFSGKKIDAKLDVSRRAGFEQIITDYDTLARDVQSNPTNANAAIDTFRSKYTQERIAQIFNTYALVATLNDDLSVDLAATTKERGNFGDQPIETLYGRILWRFDIDETRSGFARAFAALPVFAGLNQQQQNAAVTPGRAAPQTTYGATFGNQNIGVVGVGGGIDLFDQIALRRVAFDVGVTLSNQPPREQTQTPVDWRHSGYFAQGVLEAFSNILESSREYKRVKAQYDAYGAALVSGAYERIPSVILTNLFAKYETEHAELSGFFAREGVSPAIAARFKKGEDVLTDEQKAALLKIFTPELQKHLKKDFNTKTAPLREKFDGSVRAYLAADAYFFSDRDPSIDLGGFVEWVDRVRDTTKLQGYVIGALRDASKGIYAGIDYTPVPQVVIGALGAIERIQDKAGEKKTGVGAGVSVRWIFSDDISASLFAHGRTQHVPVFTPSTISNRQSTGSESEWGIFFFLTIGGQEQGPTLFLPPSNVAVPEPIRRR